MRRYWTGTTEQSMPRAAPAVWPMPHHRAMGDSLGRLYTPPKVDK